MNKKITDLKVEQVPCKKQGFREFKITYKYKGKPVVDYKIYDDEIYHDQLDHELYRLTAQETNKRYASGKLNRYGFKYVHPKFIPLAIVCASVVAASAIVVPTVVVLTRPPIDWLAEPLTFTCESDGLDLVIDKSTNAVADLKISTDKKDWEKVKIESGSTTIPVASLKKGQKLYVCGDNSAGFSKSTNNYFTFTTNDSSPNGRFAISGNIMSLISSENFKELKEIPCDYCFYKLFIKLTVVGPQIQKNCVVDAKNLVLPAKKVEYNEYNQMFQNQTLLKNSPHIMAEQLSEDGPHCQSMFNGCSSLSTINVDFDGSVWETNPSATHSWCGGIFSPFGIFYWRGANKYDSRSASTIPYGWTIIHKN